MNTQFRYETHTHTSEASKCSDISAADLVRYYHRLGYSGVCITDHFLNGNHCIPQGLPWEKSIDLFCKGYENACREGDMLGIDVFFGWEYSYRGTDFLTYGLDKEWLLGHPELLSLHITEYLDLARADGGFVVHAHPFREAGYIDMIRLVPRQVDAVEVVNAARDNFVNKLAAEYAAHYSLLEFAGTDNHSGFTRKKAGLESSRRLTGIDDMIRSLKDNEVELFIFEMEDEDCS